MGWCLISRVSEGSIDRARNATRRVSIKGGGGRNWIIGGDFTALFDDD